MIILDTKNQFQSTNHHNSHWWCVTASSASISSLFSSFTWWRWMTTCHDMASHAMLTNWRDTYVNVYIYIYIFLPSFKFRSVPTLGSFSQKLSTRTGTSSTTLGNMPCSSKNKSCYSSLVDKFPSLPRSVLRTMSANKKSHISGFTPTNLEVLKCQPPK